MPYAFEGGICTDEREGAIQITEDQYAKALAGIEGGQFVTINGGFTLVDPPSGGEEGGTKTDGTDNADHP